MDLKLRQAAIALYDCFTHDNMDRRVFMAEMTKLAGTAAAAQALIAGIAASPAAAQVVPADDVRLIVRRGPLGMDALKGYVAAPRAAADTAIPAVIVVHENRGLNAHIEDVARRVALAGFFAVAPDFLTPLGGTPADEDQARETVGQLNLEQSVQSAVDLIGRLPSLGHVTEKVGAIGFCWGGAFINRLALAAGDRLDAGVSFYGTAPDPAEAARIQTPLLLHYAGLDERVNRTGLPWADALREAGKTVTAYTYPGVNHAFHNDTSAERYDQEAASLSWERTVAFLRTHLASS